MSETSITANPTARRSFARRWSALAAIVLVPLAFAGLFVGAVANADQRIDHIPAAIVNNDQLVTQTAADGTQSQILAGRQLVTQLTGPGQTGFDWQITNSKDAAKLLADGDVYAVLTIPKSFSASIVSISTTTPAKATFSIDTDDAHSYIGGAVAQIVASTLTSKFGSAITEQYLEGVLGGYADVGSSLSSAADGADKLATGADDLAAGLGTLSDGASTAASGAHEYADGVTTYTKGVGSLSDGLVTLAKGANGLTEVSDGIGAYTAGVSTTSTSLDQVNAAIQANPDVDARTKGALAQITSGLGTLSDSGSTLASGAKSGIAGVQSGISQSASGAKRLAASSAKLVDGGTSLTSGLDDLADGTAKSHDGAASLASGAHTLGDGLTAGAAKVPSYTSAQAKSAAKVISDPVTYTAHTDNPVDGVGQGIATVFVPLGLWIGALAVFLVLRPVSRRSLTSTAPNRRLVFAAISRAAIVTLGQAALLVAFLHTVLKVPVSELPATILFSFLMALAFTAFHYLLTIGLGRGGLVVSIFLLAVQITSTGGIYPIQLVSGPFQAISPFMPLTYGVQGMQAIITGGPIGGVVTAAVVLFAFGALSVIVSLAAIRRTRRAVALGILPSAG